MIFQHILPPQLDLPKIQPHEDPTRSPRPSRRKKTLRTAKVSAGIDGTTTGTLAAPSDLNCPYIILIGTLGWRERGSGGSKIMRIMRRASEMAGWEETEDLMGMPWWRHTHMHIL